MKKNDNFKKVKEYLKKFWNYLWHDDSLGSYVLNFVVAFIFIKFIFFPVVGFALNNDYPIVSIVSGSMEHKIVDNLVCDKNIVDVNKKNLDFEQWWGFCGGYYTRNYNLSQSDFENYPYKNGLNIGDVMILYGKDPGKIEVGEVLVFIPQDKVWFNSHGPVIHRVVQKWQAEDGKYHFRTKGDHNAYSAENFEDDITEDNVIGVAKVRIPIIGYATIYLNKIWQSFLGLFS